MCNKDQIRHLAISIWPHSAALSGKDVVLMARWRSLHAPLCAGLYSEAGDGETCENHKLQQRTEMLKTTAERRKSSDIPLRPLAQTLSSRPRSIGQPQRAGCAETRLPLTTSQSIVADYQSQRRADAAAPLHWRSVSLSDHTETQVC